MRGFWRILVLTLAVAASVKAEAKEYSYEQRDQFCTEFFKAVFASDDKAIDALIRDNTQTLKDRADFVISQAISFGKLLKEGLKGAPLQRMVLAESKNFTLVDQRYYLIDAGEPLFLGYCFVRDMGAKVHFVQFSLTSQEAEFAKFFARGW